MIPYRSWYAIHRLLSGELVYANLPGRVGVTHPLLRWEPDGMTFPLFNSEAKILSIYC